ncbi:endonuclease-reverse transcriptase [Elysia marginata]|uniref:Endonuclease-reverse transcriptase n=1 Tax=Elysia marginata TaxID=1093978 RepID=A0AAV4FQ93_9GAST|nr:endonuclease-reverse transcriptase [Elysia marginata]
MFKRMKNILTNPHMSIETRKRVPECYMEPILMYKCETWIISKQTRGRLEVTKIWFLRRMRKIGTPCEDWNVYGRGRLREKTTDGLASWLGVGSTVEIIKMIREHDAWRGMIANAMRYGTG